MWTKPCKSSVQLSSKFEPCSTRVDEFAVKHERELQLSIFSYFHEEKIKEITTVSVVLYVIKNRVYLYINFSFDFLGLDNVDF
jgi:hypothetical protein